MLSPRAIATIAASVVNARKQPRLFVSFDFAHWCVFEVTGEFDCKTFAHLPATPLRRTIAAPWKRLQLRDADVRIVSAAIPRARAARAVRDMRAQCASAPTAEKSSERRATAWAVANAGDSTRRPVPCTSLVPALPRQRRRRRRNMEAVRSRRRSVRGPPQCARRIRDAAAGALRGRRRRGAVPRLPVPGAVAGRLGRHPTRPDNISPRRCRVRRSCDAVRR